MKRVILIGLLLVLLGVGGVASAQTGGGYDLTWWTVDAGGGAVSGGGYSLVGSIGQPDAGAMLSGGGYILEGGFWNRGACAPWNCRAYLPAIRKD